MSDEVTQSGLEDRSRYERASAPSTPPRMMYEVGVEGDRYRPHPHNNDCDRAGCVAIPDEDKVAPPPIDRDPSHYQFVPYTRPWVMRLPLREQGTLMAGIRGCDTVVDSFIPRTFVNSNAAGGYVQVRHPAKAIVAALRYIVGTPHDEREVDTHGAFMASELPPIDTWPTKCLDDLPLHFVMHFMHAIEVVAYRLPDRRAAEWRRLYERICEHMHVTPEMRVRMIERLSEDRIALGTVQPVTRPAGSVGPEFP